MVVPEQLLKEIDALVGNRQRSSVSTKAAEKELIPRRQLKALETAAAAGTDKDHPQLKGEGPDTSRRCGVGTRSASESSSPAEMTTFSLIEWASTLQAARPETLGAKTGGRQ